MIRIACPQCGTPDRVDERDEGREVECRRCRTAYMAEPVETPRDELPTPARNDGGGAAVYSLLLGIASVLTSPCCGAGAIFGLGGLITGFGGLQSRRRVASIFGLILSTAGLFLSLGIIAIVATAASSNRDVPPKPDGTQAPFAHEAN